MLGNLTMLVGALPALVVAVISIIPSLAIGVASGILIYKKIMQHRKADAESEYARILEEANAEAKDIRKDAMIDMKEEQLRLRNEFEKESKEKRIEIQRHESRIHSKEDSINKKESILDRKLEQVDKTRRDLDSREQRVKSREAEAEKHQELMRAELERVAALTRDEAKELIIKEMESDARKDAVNLIKEIEREAREEGDKKAQNIVALAIQRCAVDQSSETTTAIVSLPNDDMKGRIIGREGRNIKALESTLGVDIIIDDTPDIITLSGFDPVRREVAKQTIEKMLLDGRFQPARIEEVADRIRRDIVISLKEAGESAVSDAGMFGIHGDLVRLLGRLKFRTSYGQNVLKHSLEVSHLAGLLASELGADVKTAKRAGLLHDIGKAVDHEFEGTHVQIGVDIAKKYHENEKVIHAIAAHHGDVEATTVEAIIVQVADAISGSRPGARRDSIEFYVKRLEKMESLANSFAGVDQSYAIQAGREIRIIVKPEKVSDAECVLLAKDIAKKLESELEYPGQIKVNVIRELRSVEYAK
ncbi:MAG: ribonuclease Y [Christensenellaceae bacterium]|jgi:ribonuclease Y|nr:ribonuclease Y [Christensenellaceae bacterium]